MGKSPNVPESVIGQTLDGKYGIVRLLGGGGMGMVYEAQAIATGERVAIKVLTAEIAANEAVKNRFQREAKASATLETRHIVRVLGAEKDSVSGLPYMIMEYLDGEDVGALLDRLGPLPPQLALRIVAQACLGLEKAHEAKVVHRDIKPANLFLARDDDERVVKVVDFGIAKVKDQASHAETKGLTRTGSMLGSPLYMSPEQARGAKNIDFRADVWSLGVVLYEALSGRTPYHEIDALGELIIAICSDIPPPVQDFAPWVPTDIAAIVHTALRLDPDARFQSVKDLLKAIAPLLPDGFPITEDMLRPLSDEERGRKAPRLPLSAYGTTESRPRASIRGSVCPVSADLASAATLHAATADGVSQPSPIIRRQRSAGRLAAGAAAAALAIGGLLTYKLALTSAPADPTSVSAALTPTSAATAAVAAAAAPSSSSPSSSSTSPAPSSSTARLTIAPEGASVEVDGTRVTPKDGAVDLIGAPGSIHRVRVFLARPEGGEVSTTESVVMTERGPLPAKIALPAPDAASRPGTSAALSPNGAGASRSTGSNSNGVIPKTTVMPSPTAATTAATPSSITTLDTKFE